VRRRRVFIAGDGLVDLHLRLRVDFVEMGVFPLQNARQMYE